MFSRSSAASSSAAQPVRLDLSAAHPSAKTNPIGYRDVEEIFTRHACLVTGAHPLPAWLEGDYLKQTGAAFQPGVDLDTALLDGLAGIAAFHFAPSSSSSQGGAAATFSNAVLDSVHSRTFLQSKGRVRTWYGTARGQEHGSSNRLTLWERAQMWWNSNRGEHKLYTSFNPNVVVWRLCGANGGEDDDVIGAATEADGIILRFSPHDLTSLGPYPTLPPATGPTFSSPSKGVIITTPAHYYEAEPYHVALEMDMLGYMPPSFQFTYGIYLGSKAPLRRVTGLPVGPAFSYTQRHDQPPAQSPAYMHCYAQTKRYLILFLSSTRLDYGKMLDRDFEEGFFGLFRKNTSLPLQLVVLDKQTGLREVGRFQDGHTSCHVWHMSNAYEVKTAQGGSRTTTKLVIDCTGTDDIHGELASFLMRIELDDVTGASPSMRIQQRVCDTVEFAQINPLCNFAPYRFTYLLRHAATARNSLVKFDWAEKRVVAEAFGGGEEEEEEQQQSGRWLLAEPVFVPRLRKYGALSSEEEEDGVVLLAVTDVHQASSFLAVLRPKDLTEICRVHAPTIINVGLHSHFFPKQKLMCKI